MTPTAPTLLSPAAFASVLASGQFELLDVRTPVEFAELHVQGAKNIPLDQLDPQAFKWPNTDVSRPIYVVCWSGSRGKKGCEMLASAGFTNVFNIDGGTLACESAGLPVVRGKKAMSLARQVSIATGSIALIGALLALLVDVWFALIPACIGGGLTFAGLTDTCAMGMLLARMPWNRQTASSDCAVK